MSREEAIRRAVVDCINQNILKTFLENHKREVIGMLLHEWNLDTAVAFAEERGEGLGRKKEKIEIAQKLKAKGMSINDIIDATGLTVDDILPL